MKVISAYLMKVILIVPDEGYSSVPDEGYSSVPDEGYSSVPDEGYSRNESCTLNLISTFLLYKRIHVVMLCTCTCILYPQVEVYIYMYDNFLRNNW